MVSSRKRIRFHLMGHLDRERQNLTLRIQTAENKTYTQPAVVLPPFVPFAQAFSTVITTALTGSLYYIAASPKGSSHSDERSKVHTCRYQIQQVLLAVYSDERS
ncbi:hypothetical protein RND81_06G072100 [Saponaria officinalis]|uniref:Uncharacterized protein n=1 Tax=Saponaria officinalis TaxID=3572 RepID=A0AAW1K8S4_SAPOF